MVVADEPHRRRRLALLLHFSPLLNIPLSPLFLVGHSRLPLASPLLRLLLLLLLLLLLWWWLWIRHSLFLTLLLLLLGRCFVTIIPPISIDISSNIAVRRRRRRKPSSPDVLRQELIGVHGSEDALESRIENYKWMEGQKEAWNVHT